MISFIKAQFNSLISTTVDFTVMIMLTNYFLVWYVMATALGALVGAITNFTIGRMWVFQAGGSKIKAQALKYALVWGGSLLLNTGGVYFVTETFQIEPAISKIMVAIIVGFTFNYFLQKRFVFSAK